MDTEEFSILTVSIVKRCEKSFLTVLDHAQIPHGRMQTFACVPGAPIVEVISAPSNRMPWTAIAGAIKDWLKHKHGRAIIISTQDGAVSPAEGCSMQDIKNLLTRSVDILVLDASSTKQNSRLPRTHRATHKLAS